MPKKAIAEIVDFLKNQDWTWSGKATKKGTNSAKKKNQTSNVKASKSSTKPQNLGGATRGPNPSELPQGPIRKDQKEYLKKVEQAGKPKQRKKTGGKVKGYKHGGFLGDAFVASGYDKKPMK